MNLKQLKKRAFTLIELIIVIVLIGILAGMSLPKFIGVQRNAKVAAMVRDIDTLEKAIKLYENDNDSLPIYDVGIDGSNLEDPTKDMEDIYLSLKETLSLSADGEEYLYKVNMEESGKYHSKTKYGYGKTESDFYVYSTKTNKVYYYGYLINGDNTLQHNDIKTSFSLKTVSSEKKKISLPLNRNIVETPKEPLPNPPVEEEKILELDHVDFTGVSTYDKETGKYKTSYYYYTKSYFGKEKTKGKWYAEMTADNMPNLTYTGLGVILNNKHAEQNMFMLGYGANEFAYSPSTKVNSYNRLSYGTKWEKGDVIGILLDMDNLTLSYTVNGVNQGVAYNLPEGNYRLAFSIYTSGEATVNLGQFDFKYNIPEGYKPFGEKEI